MRNRQAHRKRKWQKEGRQSILLSTGRGPRTHLWWLRQTLSRRADHCLTDRESWLVGKDRSALQMSLFIWRSSRCVAFWPSRMLALYSGQEDNQVHNLSEQWFSWKACHGWLGRVISYSALLGWYRNYCIVESLSARQLSKSITISILGKQTYFFL